MYKEITPEMKELVEVLWKIYRDFWVADRLGKYLEDRVMGEDGGIPEIRKNLTRIEQTAKTYRKALRACERRLELEAHEIYAIPDLPRRIKDRLVRLGCRTRMDIHLTTIWKYKNPGWGRKSERALSEWKSEHFISDHDEYKVESSVDDKFDSEYYDWKEK